MDDQVDPAALRAEIPQTRPGPVPQRSIPAAPPLDAPRPVAPARRRGWGWLIVLLVLAVAAGVLIYLHPWRAGKGAGGHKSMTDTAQPVREATAATGDIPVLLNALGTVTPLATVTVKTQIAGQLTTIGFTEGQLVRQGDFLAQIDPRPYQIQLEQYQGQLGHDQALLKNAQIDLARYTKLNAQDSIARQQVDTQAALVRQYEGTVQSDQALVDNAKLNLVYCHITSPVTGRVGLRQVDQGNYVQTSDANGLVVVTQLQPISVLFSLPEDNLPAIMPRLAAAGAGLLVTAYDRSNTTKIATGTLATVDNQIDTTTGMVKLRAMFDNADRALFPNQFVNARLLVDTIRGTLIVPTAAIQSGAPGTYVYLVQADGTVTVRPVKLGVSDGERVQVLSGLAAGDRVVIDGADRLKEGAKVSVPDAATTTPGKTPAPAP